MILGIAAAIPLFFRVIAMNRKKKGEYGYLKYQKIRSALVTAVMFAAMLVLYFSAKAYFGTNQNLFSIISALICLPVAKFAVDMIMFWRAPGCSDELHRRITQVIEGSPAANSSEDKDGLYDLYMTTREKNYQISFLTESQKAILAVTEDDKCDINAAQDHIRRMLQSNGIHGYTVKVYRDEEKFLARLTGAAQAPAGLFGGGKADSLKSLITSISL